jgi:hypothetical protein
MHSVRLLARIGSWAQLKNTSEEAIQLLKSKSGKENKDGTQKKPKKKKAAIEISSVDVAKAQRSLGSSFEAGHLSTGPEISRLLGKKQSRILNLPGMSAMMRLPAPCSGSNASSLGSYGAPISNGKLSVNPGFILFSNQRDRLPSAMSTASSLRPLLTSSADMGASSAASVKWDEEGLEMVKERRKHEREMKSRRESQDSEQVTLKSKNSTKDSRRQSGEGRKRTFVMAIFGFPDTWPPIMGNPILTVEEATVDEHDIDGLSSLVHMTPVKRPHLRPLSEQLLGRARPQAMHEEESGNFYLPLHNVQKKLTDI